MEERSSTWAAGDQNSPSFNQVRANPMPCWPSKGVVGACFIVLTCFCLCFSRAMERVRTTMNMMDYLPHSLAQGLVVSFTNVWLVDLKAAGLETAPWVASRLPKVNELIFGLTKWIHSQKSIHS